jgi:hypothetical protein
MLLIIPLYEFSNPLDADFWLLFLPADGDVLQVIVDLLGCFIMTLQGLKKVLLSFM